MTVTWGTNRAGNYYALQNAPLAELEFRGVYLIWERTERTGGRIVRTAIRSGSGLIADRLSDHHATFGDGLFVTWARIDSERVRLGVERFLHDHYQPTRNERAPDVPPIEVNLPW